MTPFQWTYLLLAGHSLADTALQPNTMSSGKYRVRTINPRRVPVGQTPMKLWVMWLTHHAMVHGLIVYLITQSFALGIIETITHWIIDFGKCESLYNPYVDQGLHIIMKLVYVLYLTRSML